MLTATGLWFGTPWPSILAPAPPCRNQQQHVDPPLLLACIMCGQEIREHDSGLIMTNQLITLGGPDEFVPLHIVNEFVPLHIECSTVPVMGRFDHMRGECPCTGFPRVHRTIREEGQLNWSWMLENGLPPCP